MITILSSDGNGTYLGADEDGNLYDGESVFVGDDELTIETTVDSGGDSFTRVTSYGTAIIGQGTQTKEGFSQTMYGKSQTERDDAWEAEKAVTTHGKTFVNALVDGEMQSVEKKRKILIWEARS